MISLLEVDAGTRPENALISLCLTAGSLARPGTHGLDRKCPDPKADFAFLGPLARLEKYEIVVCWGVVCVFFLELWGVRLAKMN